MVMREKSWGIELLLAGGAGAVAGMRTFSALAWGLRARDARGRLPLDALAALELLGDKLPFAPDRISPPSLIARAASGAASAILLAPGHSRGRQGALGAAGATGAVAAAFGAYHLRRFLNKKAKIPDALLGAAEDAATQALGSRLLREARAA